MLLRMKALQSLVTQCGSVRQLALRLKYSHPYIYDVINGRQPPSFEFFRRVRREFGIILDPIDFEPAAARRDAS
ncbi:MAG: transcriptional regulator with XRE-family HTH domain [Myxococcota bacterium]|jgi:transcriptional regulator with XRE-family HTH domain